MFKHLIFIFLLNLLEVRSDLCGQYAVLTEVQSFYITQPFTQTVNFGFENYFSLMTELQTQAKRFQIVAQNYTSKEKLNLMEPSTLIPFGPDKNLIKIPETQHTLLMAECQKHGAQLLSFDPLEKPYLLDIMKQHQLTSIPFFSYHTPKSLLSRGIKLIESPEVPANMAKIGITGYPLLKADGTIGYPDVGRAEADFRSVALCEKENNYWDRNSNNQNIFTNVLNKILKKIPQLISTSKTFFETITATNKLPKHTFSSLAAKFSISGPPSLVQVVNLFQKYNNKNSWEISKPNAISDFLNFQQNFNKIKNLFKFKSPKMLTDQITFSNNSILLSTVEEERLLAFIGLDPDQFGIVGGVGLQPLMTLPDSQAAADKNTTSSTSVTAQLSMNIYDKRDLMKIYAVQPLISNEQITSVTHVVQTPRYVQATESEPLLHNCKTSPKEEIPICEGFQTSKVDTYPQSSLLICGRALTQKNISVDYDKCPQVPAPSIPLTYRASCDGERMVVLSSTHPLKIKVYCDTFVEESKQFDSFPVYIQTECEIREALNDTDKILLPQLQTDFLQQQRIKQIITSKPVITVTGPPQLMDNPIILISGVFAIVLFILIAFMILILALFDPQKCKNITGRLCCCFLKMHTGCQTCCNKSHCCQPVNDITQIEMQYRPRRNKYSTNNSIASAPHPEDKLDEDEIATFMPIKQKQYPAKSPALSARSSFNELRFELKKSQNNAAQKQT